MEESSVCQASVDGEEVHRGVMLLDKLLSYAEPRQAARDMLMPR